MLPLGWPRFVHVKLPCRNARGNARPVRIIHARSMNRQLSANGRPSCLPDPYPPITVCYHHRTRLKTTTCVPSPVSARLSHKSVCSAFGPVLWVINGSVIGNLDRLDPQAFKKEMLLLLRFRALLRRIHIPRKWSLTPVLLVMRSPLNEQPTQPDFLPLQPHSKDHRWHSKQDIKPCVTPRPFRERVRPHYPWPTSRDAAHIVA